MSEDELRAFVQPDETAFELLARCAAEPIPTGLAFLGSLRAGQVLEVSGPSGTAKTEVLIQIAVHTVLPPQTGQAENILYMDLDAKFDPLRLIQVLNARIAQMSVDRATMMQECLQRFHLVQCRSSYELLAVLKTVKPLLQRLQAQGGLRLVLVDNIAACYWVDRARRPVPAQPPAVLTLHAVHAALATDLRQILRTCHCAAVVTQHAMLAGSNPAQTGGEVRARVMDPQSALWTPREFLPQSWQELVTHKVLLRPIADTRQGRNSQVAAKWHKPSHDHIYVFCVTDLDLQPAQ